MYKKRIISAVSLLLAVMLAFPLPLTSCGSGTDPDTEAPDGGDGGKPGDTVELTLWTYPVGGWGSSGTLSSMIALFHRDHPDIRVTTKVLSYEEGDAEIEDAIKNGTSPDLVLEGPERLAANWGERGLMADISDIWAGGQSDKIYESVRSACRSGNAYYIYPICMTTHCMAINRDLFEASGAWQYVDEETHTWTTDGFVSAVRALRDYGVENVAAVYCGGQGGDQGTRALVNNLYSGTFTDPQHTKYTVNSQENIKALELLRGMDGITFDPGIVGTDEIEKFCAGELAMAFCWNVFMEVRQVVNDPNLDFDIFPMAFPTDDGNVQLQGGIWGFGIFDNGDEKRIEAAKEFIRFMTEDDSIYKRAVLASTYWPVRDMPDIYENDRLMQEYGIFQQYLGDYYQVTPGWTTARTEWWGMLQRIGGGEDAAKAVEEFSKAVNGE